MYCKLFVAFVMDRVQILKIIILIPEIGTEKEAANVYDAVEVHITLTAIIQSIYPKISVP